MPFSILVIDDDLSIRLLLKDVLEEQGYQVYEAADGVAGLQQFKILQPDLVSLDITMPRLDGLAVLKEIRRQNAVVGVLMISALRSESVVTEANASGADGYLYKPFKLEALLEEIQRVSTVAHIRRSASFALCNQGDALADRASMPLKQYSLRQWPLPVRRTIGG